jgi:hypothetical protein
MGVLLQAFYQRKDIGVASPDGGEGSDWWWSHLAKQAQSPANVGFTAIWLLPATKGLEESKSLDTMFLAIMKSSQRINKNHTHPLWHPSTTHTLECICTCK